MSTKIKYLLSISLFLGLFIVACDPKDDDNDWVYNPTSVTVSLPAFVNTYLGAMPIPSDNPLTEEGIALGRRLFYDKRLSNDNTMSCATCHLQEHAFDDPRRFSEGTNGALGNRNAMSIQNLSWANAMFWDGRRETLEQQAHDPVTNPIEMRNTWTTVESRLRSDANYPQLFYEAFGTADIDSNLVVKAIAQFERTLVSFHSPFDDYYFNGNTNALTEQQIRGKDIYFGKGHCNDCHSDVLLTDNQFRNNGLDNVLTDIGMGKPTQNPDNNGKFKVPTLRNIALTAPYMHDGRFPDLQAVVDFYSHGIQPNSPNIDEHVAPFGNGFAFNPAEKADLIAFLQSFTDTSFINNPNFSNPNP